MNSIKIKYKVENEKNVFRLFYYTFKYLLKIYKENKTKVPEYK